MTTSNKFIVERTVVGYSNTALGATYGDVTGLSWYGKAGDVYKFKATVVYDASVTTEGAAFSISGPASPTVLAYTSIASTMATEYGNAYDLPAAAPGDSVFVTDNIATVEGIISPSSDGTISIRGIKSGGTMTVQGTSSVLTWSRLDWPDQP